MIDGESIPPNCRFAVLQAVGAYLDDRGELYLPAYLTVDHEPFTVSLADVLRLVNPIIVTPAYRAFLR